MKRLKTVVYIVCSLLCAIHTQSFASHGISIDGVLKYPADFTNFDYVSPRAVKGEKLTLHEIGSFDKLNPYSLKGEAPLGVDELIFEPLAVSSMDEPFALYGLLAEDIELAADKKSVTYTLNGKAQFSTGKPVTSSDVAYTIDVLKSAKVHPYYNYYYQDISGYKVLDDSRIQVLFKQPNRELHMITSQMKILPKDLETNGFWLQGQGGVDPVVVVGSGPYIINEMSLGRTISYRRNKNYWGRDLPARKGMYNFDDIVVKYYKDQVIALEAFKAGEFDFMSVNIAKQWARDVSGEKFKEGLLIKKTFQHVNNAGMQGFTMNTRKELFEDPRVRKALGLALDFEWINGSLFHNQYTRNDSFFSNSYLAARGLPGGLELSYLNEFKDQLPKEVFTTPLSPPVVKGKRGARKNLLEAKKLLQLAGWKVRQGKLLNGEGKEFVFDILLASPAFERVMAAYVKNLKKLGITADYRTVDAALYVDRVKRFEFDMIVSSYGQSQSPGNEQRSYWHSSAADKVGSRNYAGVKSEVVDNLVEKVIYAENQEQLTASCKALDRVLWYGYYLVPNWYLAVHRLAYTDEFLQPEVLPLYYNPFQLLMTWWKK